MQSIIEKLFIATLEELDRCRMKNKEPDEEDRAYEKLCAMLDEGQKENLNSFLELYSQRKCKEAEELFFSGFKTGILLILEAFYPNPST